MKTLSNQLSDQADTIMQSLFKPRERRIYDDSFAYADRATWLDAHQIKEDRRRPRNIVNECNQPDGCCCHQSSEANDD